ncbi:MAG TPA: glycosyltransferase [Pyrinomonadaceae bacterium]|nr:glycosyltransferase [Pyrinomonadaceae bacterium]
MRGLRILITNHFLRGRTGSELYVCELATNLLRRGHSPIVYSPQLGHTARELRDATVPIVDNLDAIGSAPDLIHGQHHVETMSALLRYPNTPAVFFCHGWLPWEETPPKHPRILRYVAVDDTCFDRLVSESGIPDDRVSVILNSVELEEFLPRAPLPAKPARALVFSNGAKESTHLGAVREACRRSGLSLDVVGAGAGNVAARPQDVLGQYDIVFAKARCALEAMAVGSAVVLCDIKGAGPMVTAAEVDRLRRLNFGIRTLRERIDADVLEEQIARYDPHDAATVSQRIRDTAGRGAAIDQTLGLYQEVINEFLAGGGRDHDAEARAEAAYLRDLNRHFEAERDSILQSRTFRWRRRMLNVPVVGDVLRAIARRFGNTN